MIISHKHKFIFIKTRKTAGTSIEIALSSICGEDDIITPISFDDEKERKKLKYRGPQNYKINIKKYSKRDFLEFAIRRKRLCFYNHMPAEEIVKYIDKKTWDNYFKFTFDRNPYDKIVSLFYYMKGDEKYKSILSFLKNGNLNLAKSYDMYTLNRIVAVDKIYKFEEMQEAFIDISVKLKLEKALEIPKFKAKSSSRKVKNPKHLLDNESIKIIDIALAREIKLLGYNLKENED